MSTLKDALNRTQPGTLADALRLLSFGDILRALITYLFGAAPAVGNSYVGVTVQAITLPNDAKCLKVERLYARGGTGTKGPLALSADNSPGAGEYYVTPTGDITFYATDAWTILDLVYIPEKGEMVERSAVPVAAHSATIPADLVARGVVLAAEIESLAGTLVAKMIVDPPGTSVATGHAALDLPKATVKFASADAVTSCRVKLLVAPAVDVSALLEAASLVL